MKTANSMVSLFSYKKPLSLFLVTFLATFSLSAQSVVGAFVSMPDEYYLSLPTAQRKEMVRAYRNDSTATRKNKFRGQSSILTIDTINQFMSIQNTANGIVDLKLLKTSNTASPYFVALIFTACAPVCDSHIGFYDNNWRLLRNSLIPKITITDFLDVDKIKKDGKTLESVADQFDFVFVQFHFIQNENNLEATLNSEKYMDSESFKRIKVYLKGSKLLFTWKNGEFENTNCYW